MTKTEIYQNIIDFFENNEDAFNEIIEELDNYNGYLGDDRYYLMDELPELLSGYDAISLLNRAYFGRDDESWHTDANGNKIYNSFNPNRKFFYFNGYGNLCSADFKDYSDHLDNYFVDDLLENYQYLYYVDDYEELIELIEKFEALED